jgi:signal transduction histidine kinase
VSQHLEAVPRILGDPDQLRSVVTNLVMNARDAVGNDGRIEVHTHHRPGEVVLSVSDNGCGMSRVFVSESLFRPFQTTKTSGLGIGLFQTRAIVQSHGGRIHVDSEEGRGTTFTATFPALGAQ